MKTYISNIIPRIKEFSGSLEKKELFVDKPWVWLNENSDQEKIIFKRNGELIMSLNGIATLGKWEYISTAKCLLIDRVKDKILLNQSFIDSAVMVLKQDGLKGENIIFANEILIPDLDVKKYLKTLFYELHAVNLIELEDGQTLEVYGGGENVVSGKKVMKNIDEQVSDGEFITSKGNIIKIKSGIIIELCKPSKIDLMDGRKIIVQHQLYYYPISKGNFVYNEDGSILANGKYTCKLFERIHVEDGKITRITPF